jgi:hypothetical protein
MQVIFGVVGAALSTIALLSLSYQFYGVEAPAMVAPVIEWFRFVIWTDYRHYEFNENDYLLPYWKEMAIYFSGLYRTCLKITTKNVLQLSLLIVTVMGALLGLFLSVNWLAIVNQEYIRMTIEAVLYLLNTAAPLPIILTSMSVLALFLKAHEDRNLPTGESIFTYKLAGKFTFALGTPVLLTLLILTQSLDDISRALN